MPNWYEIPNADSIPSPSVLIYPDRIEANLRHMIELIGDVSKFRPHVKTHKMAEIVKLKLSLGITKFKAATLAECEMVAEACGKDILLAYPLVGPNISRFIGLIKHYQDVVFAALVDDETVLHEISNQAQIANCVIRLYVDLNVGMNRTGIAVGDQARLLYHSLSSTPNVIASGLHAYDGHLHETDFNVLQQKAAEAFTPVWQLAQQLEASGFLIPNIVVSGTPTSRILAQGRNVEVGAGTVALWDFGQIDLSPDLSFLNAAVVLARVISKPSSDRLCIDLGHKAVASEMAHPRIRFFGLEDAVPVMHSEEHLVLQTHKASNYPIGSVLYGIPRHVCPTIALHDEVVVVKDGVASSTWSVAARSRKLRGSFTALNA